jgi:hypothetical protein
MLCEVCHGRRLVWRRGQPLPCLACGGLGELNCCEGLSDPPPTAPPEAWAIPGEPAPAGEKPPGARNG